MHNLNKMYLYIILSVMFLFAQGTYEQIDKKDGRTYFNPSWGTDSRSFTVEVLTEGFSDKTSELQIGLILPDNTLIWSTVFKEEKNDEYPMNNRNKYYERNIGWIRAYNLSDQLFIAISDKDNSLKTICLDRNSTNFDNLGICNNLFGNYEGEPSFFTTSNQRLYFVTLSEDDRIYYTNDADPENLEGTNAINTWEDEFRFSLPIRSISASSDDTFILVATYTEALSKIYKVPVIDGKIDNINRKSIPKPDKSMHFIGTMFDSHLNNRYVLIGSNSDLDLYSQAYAYVINNT